MLLPLQARTQGYPGARLVRPVPDVGLESGCNLLTPQQEGTKGKSLTPIPPCGPDQ